MKYFYNTSWMFAEQMLRMIAGVLVGIWVARYLGPEQFGIFSYALAFTAIFSSIAKLGLDSIVVRDLVNEPDKRDIYLGTAFWLKLIGAFITLGIVALATLFTSNDSTTNVYIFIIASGMIFQSFEVIDFYFQSKVLSKFVSLCKITQLILSSALKLYFVLTAADLVWFVIVTLIDQVTLAVTLSITYKYQKIGRFYSYFDLTIAKKILINSYPLIFSSLIVIVHMQVDRIMIKEMLGEREVGLFSAAARLSEVFHFVPIIIAASFFSAAVNAKKISEKLYRERQQMLYTFMTWIAIAIALPITFLSEWLVTLLYGNAYREAWLVLAIHIWGIIFIFHVSARSSFLLIEQKQRYVTLFAMLTLVVHLLFSFVLINIFGLIGASCAAVISWFLCVCIFPLFFTDTRRNVFMFFNFFAMNGHLWKLLHQK